MHGRAHGTHGVGGGQAHICICASRQGLLRIYSITLGALVVLVAVVPQVGKSQIDLGRVALPLILEELLSTRL